MFITGDLSEAEKKMLVAILRKMKSDRSPYVPIQYFRHHPDHKGTIKKLIKRGLAFRYKADAIGLAQEGALLARTLLEDGY